MSLQFFLGLFVFSTSLGFSHNLKLFSPVGLKLFCFKDTHVLVKSSSKSQLGKFILGVRQLKKLDVYKNKGIIVKGETLRNKKFKKK